MWQAVLVVVVGWVLVAGSAAASAWLVLRITERSLAAGVDAALRVRFGDGGEGRVWVPGSEGDVVSGSVTSLVGVPDWTDALLPDDVDDPGWSLPGDGPDMVGEQL